MSRYFIVTPDVSKNLKDQPKDDNALGYCTLYYGKELKIMRTINRLGGREMSKINITDMRCWGKKIIDGEWILGFYFAYNGVHFIKNPEDNNNYEIDLETLRRCTGLYDKDSKLIYDGDIIEYVQISADPLNNYIRYFIVDYKYGTCRLINFRNEKNNFCEESYLYTEAYKVKVIGNIFNDKYTSLPIMKGLSDVKDMLSQIKDTINNEIQTQVKSNLASDIKRIIESLDKYQLLKG